MAKPHHAHGFIKQNSLKISHAELDETIEILQTLTFHVYILTEYFRLYETSPQRNDDLIGSIL